MRTDPLRVSLFITCFNDTLFPETGKAVVTVLERLGWTVDFPTSQTCCGQMHLNGGYPAYARKLVVKFLDDFADSDAIVTPSSSCAATVRKAYVDLLKDDPALLARAQAMAAKTFEFCEFLTDRLGLTDIGASYPHRVTYHPTCSSLRGIGLGDRAKRLLGAVKGLELVELPHAQECCGFGGAFAVKNADTSTAMLADKMAAITSTGAHACTAVDNSCLMHIKGGLSRTGAKTRAVHIAEILASTAERPAQ